MADEDWVYKIADRVVLEGRQVFKFDEKGTEEYQDKFFAQFA